MSVEQAQALVRRVAQDPDFVARLNELPVDQKHSALAAEGYGDVKLRHLSQALPAAAGGELTDEEFSSVVGAGDTSTISVTAVASAAAAMGAAAG
jgi:hypothetical protein